MLGLLIEKITFMTAYAVRRMQNVERNAKSYFTTNKTYVLMMKGLRKS